MKARTSQYRPPDEILADLCARRYELRQERRVLDGWQAGTGARFRMETELRTGSDRRFPEVWDGRHERQHLAIAVELSDVELLMAERVEHPAAPWRGALLQQLAVTDSEGVVGASVLLHKIDVFRQSTGWCSPHAPLPDSLPQQPWAQGLLYESRAMHHMLTVQLGLPLAEAPDLQSPLEQTTRLGGLEL